jgi:hypothetical protein
LQLQKQMKRPSSEIADLYGLPLDRFTAERNALSKRLRSEGDVEGARRVGSVRKPPLHVWVTDQLARIEEAAVREFVAVHEEMRSPRDGAHLRDASERRKRLLSRLLKEARAVLERSGHLPSAQTIDRISRVLLAGAAFEPDQLMTGTLASEPEDLGLEALGLAPLDASGAEPAPAVDTRAHRRAEELGRHASAAEREAEELTRQAEDLAMEASRAVENAGRARGRAERLRAEAEEASRAAG